MVTFIESVGVATLDDFANYVRRDKYGEDLKELRARGSDQLARWTMASQGR